MGRAAAIGNLALKPVSSPCCQKKRTRIRRVLFVLPFSVCGGPGSDASRIGRVGGTEVMGEHAAAKLNSARKSLREPAALVVAIPEIVTISVIVSVLRYDS